jgi:5-methylthioadenosine/S-adenosylhomocysteine deaminase
MNAARFLDSARLGIVEGLRAGITTYADTCDSGVALQAMRELGVRGIMYQEVFCPSPDPVKVSESARALQQKLATLEPLETALQRLGISPHAPYTVSDPLFALAARSGRPMAIHVAESHLECALVCHASGVFADRLRARAIPVAPRARSPIALLQRLGLLAAHPLLIHCVQVDAEDIRAMADARCAVAHCPISNAKLAHGVAPVLEMLEAGIPVGLGTDSMASNNRMDLLEEARGAVLMQRVRTGRHDALPASRALELATIGGARALGLGDRVGSLEVGKEADLTAFALANSPAEPTYDPVSSAVFALGGQPAKFVCVAGNVRVWDWQLLAEDARLVKRVRETTAALERWRNDR